jgi:TRAP-type uncharacterized transport system substrate-binding protein
MSIAAKRSYCLVLGVLGIASAVLTGPAGAQLIAQVIPKSLEEGGPEASLRERANSWTVGIAGGLYDGSFMRFANDIGRALDDGDDLRVLPTVTRGGASNLSDLLYLRGIDVAITQADVFEYFRSVRNVPGLENRVHFVMRLPAAEMHVLVRNEVRSIEDLRGRRVHFATAGSTASLTGPLVFQRLGIAVQSITDDLPGTADRLQSGEFDAIVRVNNKPLGNVTQIPPNSGVKLLPIPLSSRLGEIYTIGELTHDDYPNLVPQGAMVDTIAVPVVLAVYNWPKNSDRYRRVERFVQRLFVNWSKLQKPPFDSKWREANLAATVPGWTRSPVAEEQLQAMASGRAIDQSVLAREFQVFLALQGGAPAQNIDNSALFREFLQWRSRPVSRQK